ncbi:MAG: phosphatase [Spirochaetaceae bacterium]|jgi:putative hydrolase|nr:phosphatase [Spirochaetaceae bacterium]
MKIEIDTHTHSIASLHAYSTIDELVYGAEKHGLRGFVLTEHGPALHGGLPHPYYFGNLQVLPHEIRGIKLFRGVELNIMDENGGLDLPVKYLKILDFVMAGLHEACFTPASKDKNTRAMLAAIENPFVDCISHPGNPAYPVDYEKVVKAATRCGKALEINNSSFKVRKGSDENCKTIARLAKAYGCLTSCGSDAHYREDVGRFDAAQAVIEEAGIGGKQLINSTLEDFTEFYKRRRAERKRHG